MTQQSESFEQKLIGIAKQLAALSKTIPLDRALERLRALGLLEGIEHQIGTEFLRRLEEKTEQKKALANYLTRGLSGSGFPSLLDQDNPARSIFFESGSTIAYVIGEYARMLSEPFKTDGPTAPNGGHVLTNNLFALTALAGVIEHVAPVSGNLLTKYFGFFPSAEEGQHPDKSTEPSEHKRRWIREIKGYQRLREDMKDCTHVVATCSNFSFLAGPLVGSRGNALAKHAIYTGKSCSSELAVCLHFEKLIPVHLCDFAMQGPKAECFCVFPGLSNGDLAATKIAEKLVEGNWHLRWLRRAKTATGELFQASGNHHAILKNSWFATKWAEEAAGTRILISLPSESPDKAVAWLRKELDVVNPLIEGIHRVNYVINEDCFKPSWQVVEVRVLPI